VTATLADIVTINLAGDCGNGCEAFAAPLHAQLASGRYDVCSLLDLPDSIDEWRAEHRTARKRADRSMRLGYRFGTVQPHLHADDIYEINTSLDERQGRPMSDSYRNRQTYTPDQPYPCPQHAVRRYGVFTGRRLVAYLWLYRAGDMGLVSSILGHGEHLRSDVMWLLVAGTVEREIDHGGFLVYNRHDSGTDGLRYFKERLGFRPSRVEWRLH